MYQGTLDPVSNRADWFIDFQLIDDDTGLVVTDFSDITFNFQVRTVPAQGAQAGWMRSPINDYYGVYGYNCGQIVLKAVSGDDHITIGDDFIEVHFTSQEMSRLTQGAYEVGLTATRNNVVEQELIVNLPIVDGVVRP